MIRRWRLTLSLLLLAIAALLAGIAWLPGPAYYERVCAVAGLSPTCADVVRW